MTLELSAHTRAIVADSLPLIERKRARLERAVDRHLLSRGAGNVAEASGQKIVGALLDLARNVVAEPGGPAAIVKHRRDVARLAAHQAWLGNFLAPMLRDTLGPDATPSVVAAWGDSYWALARSAAQPEQRLAA